MTAEIDLGVTGLIRLTFRKSSNSYSLSNLSPSPSTSSSFYNNGKSSFHQQYYSIILKCIHGHQDAIEWIKHLNQFKLTSIQNSSSVYYHKTPTK